MTARWIVFVFLLIVFPVSQINAAPQTWELDTAHSGVYFDSTHIFSIVRGHFEDFSAKLMIDPENIAGSSCSFTVKTKSINTFNRKRDTHLRSPELFDAKKYPTMTFVSRKITPKGGSTYMIEGDLTIKGVTKRIAAPFIFHGITKNPFKETQTVTGFTAQFTINRLDYGVGDGKFYRMGVIGKDVEIAVSIEAVK